MTISTRQQDPIREEHVINLHVETLRDLSPLDAGQIRGGAADQRSKTIDCPI